MSKMLDINLDAQHPMDAFRVTQERCKKICSMIEEHIRENINKPYWYASDAIGNDEELKPTILEIVFAQTVIDSHINFGLGIQKFMSELRNSLFGEEVPVSHN